MLEVEQKYRVSVFAALEAKLRQLGATFAEPVEQVDTYFAHPAKDFDTTDEALRIRQIGETNFITYKGPKIDATTKTRREIELPLATGTSQAEQWKELLQALAFKPVAAVRKIRRQAVLVHGEWQFTIALDEVEQVGTFVELELTADQSQLDAARNQLQTLAAELQLDQVERTSYLGLLLRGS